MTRCNFSITVFLCVALAYVVPATALGTTPSTAAAPADPLFDCYAANSAWGLSYAGRVLDRDGRIWTYRQVGRALPSADGGRTLDADELRAKFAGASSGAQVDAGVLAEKAALVDKAAAGRVSASDTGVRDAGTSTCHAYVAEANGARYRDIELGSDGGVGDRRTVNDAPEAQALIGWLRSIGVAKEEIPQAPRSPLAALPAPPVHDAPANSLDEFSYLSVLLSTIIGLAITQILKGYRGIVLSRARIVPYWPVLLWSASLLVMNVQSWWASFDLREVQPWTFDKFSVVLVQTILQYMLAAIVLPDFFGGERVDLREHYFGHVRWLLGLVIGVLCASLLKDIVNTGHLTNPLNLGFHLLVIALAAISWFVRNETWHKFMAVALAALFGAYIIVLFARLPGDAAG